MLSLLRMMFACTHVLDYKTVLLQVRIFWVGCFCPHYVVAASDLYLDLYIGAADRVVSFALWQSGVCGSVCCSTQEV
jgi:hypothetical protein